MRFQDIEQITRSHFHIVVPWKYLQESIKWYEQNYGLDLKPGAERAWPEKEQISYTESILKGCPNGRDIYLNCPGWMREEMRGEIGKMVLVDGRQRLTSVLRFLDNEIKAFDYFLDEFEDDIPPRCLFKFLVNDLEEEKEIARWKRALNIKSSMRKRDY